MGALTGPADFGGGLLTPASADAFVVSYDASGTHRWSHLIGGNNYDGAWSVAVSGDRVIVSCGVQGAVTVGGVDYTFPTTGLSDLLVELEAATGEVAWSRALNGTGVSLVGGDAVGTAYLVTTAPGAVDVGRGTIGATDHANFVFASYRRDGTAAWTRAAGRPTGDVAGMLFDSAHFHLMARPSFADGVVSFAVTATIDSDDFGAGAPIGNGPVAVIGYDAAAGGFVSGHRFGHQEFTVVVAQARRGDQLFIGGAQQPNDIVPSAGVAAFVASVDADTATGAALPDITLVDLAGSDTSLCLTAQVNSLVFAGAGSIAVGTNALVGLDASTHLAWARQLQTTPLSGLPVVAVVGARAVLAQELRREFDFGGGVRAGRIAIASFGL